MSHGRFLTTCSQPHCLGTRHQVASQRQLVSWYWMWSPGRSHAPWQGFSHHALSLGLMHFGLFWEKTPEGHVPLQAGRGPARTLGRPLLRWAARTSIPASVRISTLSPPREARRDIFIFAFPANLSLPFGRFEELFFCLFSFSPKFGLYFRNGSKSGI